MNSDSCLAGLVVVERGDRLATAICGGLLAELGATVIRVETGAVHDGLTKAGRVRADRLAKSGKIVLSLASSSPTDQAQWKKLVARADIVVLEPRDADDLQLIEEESRNRIVCAITTLGMDALSLNHQLGEVALQAIGGIMDCTGRPDGPPEHVHVPVVEMMTGLNAATTALAALRLDERHGIRQWAEVSAFDSELALFTTFVSTVAAGKHDGYRLGCGHHLCAPWNAYPAADGWIQLCLAGDAQWHTLLTRLGRPDLIGDPRYADNASRVRHSADIDALIVEWAKALPAGDIVATLLEAGLPVGMIRHLSDLVADAGFRERGMVCPGASGSAAGSARPGSFFAMSRTPGRIGDTKPVSDADAALRHVASALRRKSAVSPAGAKPLSGIKVLEIGPYTAGPLAGRYLADLGADVVKIEPPGGEVTRSWTPQFAGYSGYFANCNVGKKSIVLDLKATADREVFLDLLNSADVLLENLRPGALHRLGLGPDALLVRVPSLIYCSVSGFGHTGVQRPALDTIVQAEGGLMWLVGEGGQPQRVGVSVADQAISHAAPLAILAALRFRDQSGNGQYIDLAMRDILAWLTQLAWPDGARALDQWTLMGAHDGWIMANCSGEGLERIFGGQSVGENRQNAVHRLSQAGINATPVLDMGEVFAHEAVARRGLVQIADPDGACIPVLSSPHRLAGHAPAIGDLVGPPDCDRDAIVTTRISVSGERPSPLRSDQPAAAMPGQLPRADSIP